MTHRIKRCELHELVRNVNVSNGKKKSIIIETVREKFNCQDNRQRAKVVEWLNAAFFNKYFFKWKASHRNKKHFQQKNKMWLDAFIECTFTHEQPAIATGGRPMKPFYASSSRCKRRKTEDLRQSYPVEQLAIATSMKMRKAGNKDLAKLFEEAIKTPTTASQIVEAWTKQNTTKELIAYTPEEALGFMIDSKQSVAHYKLMRQGAKERNADIYPSYDRVIAAKKKCCPSKENITITESSAEVQLQALLDITCKRLLASEIPLLSTLTKEEMQSLTLTSKWGFDGSSGQAMYKQKMKDAAVSDANLFLISLVPLRLSTSNTVIWSNPSPNSTRYCRPIRYVYEKETAALVSSEKARIDSQIKLLEPTTFLLPDTNISVSIIHNLLLTMIDGKICNIITDTKSTQRCFICGALPKQMNNISEVLKRPVNENALLFGLSPLHAHIRVFEFLLHLAYRLDVKKWAVTGTHDKEILANKKKEIQDMFWKEMGLLVDHVKQGGGNSNDGNTARRFFKNSSVSARITGIKIEVIEQFKLILQIISVKHRVNVEKFRKLCIETAYLVTKNYDWYYMPVSVHKLLIHGAEIILKSELPVGLLSEEAQEARNKDYRYFREHHTRKLSRIDTNEDMFCMLLVSSDPLISLKRKCFHEQNEIPAEILQFLEIEEENEN